MKRFALVALLTVVGFADAPARAESPVLIELFASKNCAACPRAHKTLQAVEAARDDVLILTWSVSYWDYLGGKDKMALPESAERQRHYADRFSQRGPYTPQTVYDGAVQCAGNRAAKVEASIKAASAMAESGVTLTRAEARIALDGKVSGLTDVWLVEYLVGADNQTGMVNPVTRVTQRAPWLGGKTEFALPACASGCALVVQEAGFGRVLAAMDLTP